VAHIIGALTVDGTATMNENLIVEGHLNVYQLITAETDLLVLG